MLLRLFKAQNRAAVAAAGIVAVLALAVYANALQNGFAVDDVPIVLQNPNVRGLTDWKELLLGSYWPRSMELYRPVTLLSFAIDWSLAGENAAWFHAVNVGLHVLVSLLVFWLILRLGASAVAAMVGAAIFAVHPVHVEAVANIVGRAELLATIFFLLACHLHLSGAAHSVWRIVGIASCYFLALGAKEMAVSLPMVLLLLSAYRSDTLPADWMRWLRAQLPLYAALGGALLIHLALRHNALAASLGSTPVAYLTDIDTSTRLATAVRLWPEFARLLFWPQDLAWEWGPGAIHVATWGEPLVWVGAVLGISTIALAVVAWTSARWISLGIGWFIATVFVVSQIPFPIGVMLAERHLYLPSVGVALLIPALLELVPWRTSRMVRYVGAAAVVLLLGLGALRSWTRTPAWMSTAVAFMTLGREHPESYRSYWYAAGLLSDAGRPEDAIPLYEKANQLTNRRFTEVTLDYARALMAAGRSATADSVFHEAIRVAPRDPRSYLYSGELLIERERYADAIEVLERGRRSVARPADHAAAFAHHLALAYDGLGDVTTALNIRESAMTDDLPALLYPEWLHLARLHALLGDSATSRAAFDSARAAAPDSILPRLTPDILNDFESPLMRGWDASHVSGG